MTSSGYQRRWEVESVAAPADFSGGAAAVEHVEQIWLKVEPVSGTDAAKNEHVDPLTTHKITCHYRPSDKINPNVRFRRGTRVMNVQSVRNVGEENRELEIMARESWLDE